MKIGIDMDDTIECLSEAWCAWLNKKYGYNKKWDEYTDYDICKVYDELTYDQVYEPLSLKEFWETVKPREDAMDCIPILQGMGHEIYLLTNSDYHTITPKFTTVLEKYFPMFTRRNIIVCPKKQMVNVDILVDDWYPNLTNADYIGILLDAPWNKNFIEEDYLNIYKCNNWYSVIQVISALDNL